MKYIKWVVGILLAGISSILPANLVMHHTGQVDMHHLTAFQYWIQFLVVPAVAFGLFLFLACAFVPMKKRNAGVLVFSLSALFMALGAYQHYTDDGFLHYDYILRYSCFTAGLVLAFIASHKYFRNKHWAVD